MKKLLNLTLVVLFFSTTLCSQDVRPKLGLTLSGGGAKGLAHIGVLKVLEEEGIRPHFISGTSMGSIIGGLYAIGYSIEELETAARSIPWEEYFNDEVSRNLKPIEYKDSGERYQFAFPVENGKIQFPKGFIRGAKMSMLLSELTLAAHSKKSFDDFEIPFRCVATDLVTGEGYVFSEGCLADAMRASAGIPTVFEPIEIDGRPLVDGMIVRNLPVEDAINMGAGVVIAVDVGSDLSTKEELNSIIGVMDQTTAFSMVKSTKEQQALADLVIFPELEGISPLDFGNIDDIIKRGEDAARKMLPELRAMKPGLMPGKPASVKKKPLEEIEITAVEVDGLEEGDYRTVMRLLKIKPPELITRKELRDKTMSLYSSDFFTHIDYELLPEDSGYKLFIHARKSQDVYVKFGGYYDTDINAAILLNGTIRNLLLKGSLLSLDVRISETPALLADYFIHTNTRPNVGLRFNGKWNFFPGDYYYNNTLENEYSMQHASGQAGIYSGISNHSSIWFGAGTEIIVQKQKFNISRLESVKLRQGYAFAKYLRDKYNRKYFPTKGYKIAADVNYIFAGDLQTKIEGGGKTSTTGNYYINAEFSKIFPIGKKVSFQWFNQGGYVRLRQGSYVNLYHLGRELSYEERAVNFIGFAYMEQLAQRFVFTGFNLQMEPGPGYFLSVLFNYGYFELDEFDIVRTDVLETQHELKEHMAGAGFRAGMLVRQFGPLSFTTSYNFLTENFDMYLTIGYAF